MDILAQLTEKCSEPASRAALVGPGGVGKSQIAIEYTHRARDPAYGNTKETWVFWVHAATKERVQEGFKKIADVVKLPDRHKPSTDIFSLVENWLSNTSNGTWIMVLDSADNADVFFDSNQETGQGGSPSNQQRPLHSYLPQSENGKILITTRNQVLARHLTNRHSSVIEVGPMDSEDSQKLFETKGGGSDPDAVPALMEALEFMPLAISQAATYIWQATPLMTAKRYLDRFQGSEAYKTKLLSFETPDIRRDRDAAHSILRTSQISINHIHSQRPSATRRLSIMSFFSYQDIPDSVIRPIDPSQHDEFEDDIIMLRNYCLVKVDDERSIEVHALIQLSVRAWLDARKETEFHKQLFTSQLVTFSNRSYFSNNSGIMLPEQPQVTFSTRSIYLHVPLP